MEGPRRPEARWLLHAPDCTRQDGIKTRQPAVNEGFPRGRTAFTGVVIEDLIAGLVAAALIAYLVYALGRPDKF